MAELSGVYAVVMDLYCYWPAANSHKSTRVPDLGFDALGIVELDDAGAELHSDGGGDIARLAIRRLGFAESLH